MNLNIEKKRKNLGDKEKLNLIESATADVLIEL